MALLVAELTACLLIAVAVGVIVAVAHKLDAQAFERSLDTAYRLQSGNAWDNGFSLRAGVRGSMQYADDLAVAWQEGIMSRTDAFMAMTY